MEERHDEIVIYQSEDGLIKVDVLFENETVWLTQQQMAVLFGKATSTINEHIKNIYEEGELQEETTTHKFGISEFMRKAPIYYNLDVIISVGYRFLKMPDEYLMSWQCKKQMRSIRNTNIS